MKMFVSRDVHMINYGFICVWQVKKLTNELSNASEARDELAQRCHELDQQASITWMATYWAQGTIFNLLDI